MPIDPIALTRALIRCPSVTPENAGVLEVLEEALIPLGFVCHRLPFEGDGSHAVDNLFARYGSGAPHLCFAGHTDVVPAGDPGGWRYDPFGAEIHDGMLYGRGVEDMKAAIACFAAATASIVEKGDIPGSVSLLITNDEEGPGVNGTRKVLEWMEKEGHLPDYCLVGEPTNPTQLGEMAKIGRRGSINGVLCVEGTQGHVAYPHLADNPITVLVDMLHRLQTTPLDHGTDFFPPSSLQITSIDVGNTTTNMIPAKATARLNVRFNDLHTGESVRQWILARCHEVGENVSLEAAISGEAFHTEPGFLSDTLVQAVESVTGLTPALSTTGGTSDARFITHYCPVIEFGLTGRTAHQVNECAKTEDIMALTEIYAAFIRNIFSISDKTR